MNKSEQIGDLAAALAKAQGSMEKAVKDNANPFFKSKYADLASIWNACRDALSENGIAVVQGNVPSESTSTVMVETVLIHASGQWMSSTITMKPVKDDPQGVGSVITYARRYALASMVGIAPEDDDGNAASGHRDAPKAAAPPIQPMKEVKLEPKNNIKPNLTPLKDTVSADTVEYVQPKGKMAVNEATGNEVHLWNKVTLFGKENFTAGVTQDTLDQIVAAGKILGEAQTKKLLWAKFSVSSSLMLRADTGQAALAAIKLAIDNQASK